MTVSKRKKEDWLNGVAFLNGSSIASQTQIQIDKVLKLLYKLFLYSIIGSFAKIITKIFKF